MVDSYTFVNSIKSTPMIHDEVDDQLNKTGSQNVWVLYEVFHKIPPISAAFGRAHCFLPQSQSITLGVSFIKNVY